MDGDHRLNRPLSQNTYQAFVAVALFDQPGDLFVVRTLQRGDIIQRLVDLIPPLFGSHSYIVASLRRIYLAATCFGLTGFSVVMSSPRRSWKGKLCTTSLTSVWKP